MTAPPVAAQVGAGAPPANAAAPLTLNVRAATGGAVYFLAALYPWEEYLRVIENFSVVDLAWLGAFCLALGAPTTRARLVHVLFRTGYGWSAWGLLAALAVATALVGGGRGVVTFVQLAFCLVLTVPLTVVGFSLLRWPERSVGRLVDGYLGLYLFGLALCLGAGWPVIVRNAGDNRFFPVWAAMLHFLTIAAGLAVADVATPTRRGRGLVVAGAALVGILFIGSRSAVVGVLLGGAFIALRGLSPRHLLTRVLPLAALAGLGALLLNAAAEAGTLRTGANVGDAYRLALMLNAAQIIFSDPRHVLLGLGLGNGILTVADQGSVGGYQDNFVHNQFVQMALEGGVVAAALLVALSTVPLVWAVRRMRARDARGTHALLLYLAVVPFFLFHPFSTQRVFWLPLAFALAAGYAPPARGPKLAAPRPEVVA